METKEPDYANELAHWLRFDYWSPNQAFAILCEDNPNNEGKGLGGGQLEFDRLAVKKRIKLLSEIWWSGNDQIQCEFFPPQHFIEWAIQKGIDVPWLSWAQANHLIPASAITLKENTDTPQDAAQGKSEDSGLPVTKGEHISDKLTALNKAAQTFWANANRKDPETHPKNSDVQASLEKKGLSGSLAAKAATIIRPEWAHTGRKPSEP